MYSTFASGGFRVPLRAIRAVTATNGETLQRYPLSVKNVIEPGPAYLINQAMQRVAQVGTARAIQQRLDPALGIAGKTGTTNDFRDSWFAGFSGNRLSVVWLGRDDNKSIGLSGSQGALRVWMDVMANLNLEPLKLVPPSDIETALIDPKTGLLADRSCAGAETLPFLKGSVPRLLAPCNTRSRDRYGFRPGLYNPSDGRYPAQPQTGNLGNYPRADQNSRAQPQADPSRRSQNPIGDFFRRLLD
jgi:penicillin-binding protein 1B